MKGKIIALPIDVWPSLVGRIDATIKRLKASTTSEHLLRKCLDGNAFIYGNTIDRSFTIVEPQINMQTGEPELFILFAHGDGQAQENHSWVFDELARGIGAKRIRMQSPRKGFARAGWEVDEYIYSREVV